MTSKPWKFVGGLASDNHATKLFTGVRKLQAGEAPLYRNPPQLIAGKGR